MEIQVKIEKVLEPKTFAGKDGATLTRYEFVGATMGQFRRYIKFDVIGEDKFQKLGIQEGGTYNVSFEISSREWNGKWFTTITPWRAMRVGVQTPQVSAPPAQDDNLSFL